MTWGWGVGGWWVCFFFNDAATTEIYTLSLHDALPILRGISSRTLSDKLTTCQQHGLVLRSVEEGPPIRVTYQLTTHGRMCGRLLSPLVAYMKLHKELVKSDS
mgnify:CR=1 FL=1